jgi:hypothetical protein
VAMVAGAVDEAATARLRAERLPVDGDGPQRSQWQAVFNAAAMDRFAARLAALPPARRQPERRAIYARVLALLPTDFPMARADDAALAAARALLDTLLHATS